jgi:hypothetical protein
MRGKLNSDADIDLGLAISGATLEPNQTRTHDDLAAFCGVSHAAIQHIERRALRKMRIRLIELGISEEDARDAIRLWARKGDRVTDIIEEKI